MDKVGEVAVGDSKISVEASTVVGVVLPPVLVEKMVENMLATSKQYSCQSK